MHLKNDISSNKNAELQRKAIDECISAFNRYRDNVNEVLASKK